MKKALEEYFTQLFIYWGVDSIEQVFSEEEQKISLKNILNYQVMQMEQKNIFMIVLRKVLSRNTKIGLRRKIN